MFLRIRSHWAVALTPALFLPITMESGAGLREALQEAVFLAILIQFFAILPHELGHLVSSRIFGVRGGTLFLGGVFGGWLPDDDYGFNRLAPVRRLAIYAAGPAINFMVAALCIILRSCWHLHSYSLLIVSDVNVVSGLLNLIPIFPLDGGRIFRELLVLCGVRTSRQLTCVRFAAAVSGLGWMVFIFKQGIWLDWVMWLIVTALSLFLLLDRSLITELEGTINYMEKRSWRNPSRLRP